MSKPCSHRDVTYILWSCVHPDPDPLGHLGEPLVLSRPEDLISYSIKKTCKDCMTELGTVDIDTYALNDAIQRLYERESGDYDG